MDYIENLIEDIWFGEKTNVFKEEMNNNALNKKERIKLLNLINNFKQGDFSKKRRIMYIVKYE